MKWDTTVPSPCGLSLVLRHHREMMEMTWDIMVPSPCSLSLVPRHHGKMTGMMWDTTVSSPCGLSLVLGYHKSVISLWFPHCLPTCSVLLLSSFWVPIISCHLPVVFHLPCDTTLVVSLSSPCGVPCHLLSSPVIPCGLSVAL